MNQITLTPQIKLNNTDITHIFPEQKDTYDIYCDIVPIKITYPYTRLLPEPEETLVGMIELKILKSANLKLNFLLIPYITIFEEYRSRHIASDIILGLTQINKFNGFKINYIFGESTKRANTFWNKQIKKYNGYTNNQTHCHNTTGSFFIPTRHTQLPTEQGDILKQEHMLDNLTTTLLEYTYKK